MNRMQIFRSSVAGARPIGRFPGELAINWPDKQLSVVDAANQPLDLVAVRYFSTEANYVIGEFVVEAGQLWRSIVDVVPAPFDPTQWMQVSGAGGGVTINDVAPAAPQPGDLWFDSVGGQLYVRYDDGSSQQWVIAVNATQDLSGYAPLSGATFIGAVQTSFLNIETPIGSGNSLSGSRPTGIARWDVTLGDNTPETGGNAGSNFTIGRYDDAGNPINEAIVIERSTGYVSINSPDTVTLDLNKGPGADYNLLQGKRAGIMRWGIQLGDATVETGALNEGSNFAIARYIDSGGYADAPLMISRSSGVCNFSQPPTVNGVPIALLSELDELRDRLKALEDQIARPKGAR